MMHSFHQRWRGEVHKVISRQDLFWSTGDKMSLSTTYHWKNRRPLGVALILFGGVIPITLGVRGIASEGLPSIWIYGAVILIALVVGINGGIGILLQCVTVNAWGIKKPTLFIVQFGYAWNEIRGWSMETQDELRIIKFHVIGQRWIWISENDVAQPGLDRFLADIRAHSKALEIVVNHY